MKRPRTRNLACERQAAKANEHGYTGLFEYKLLTCRVGGGVEYGLNNALRLSRGGGRRREALCLGSNEVRRSDAAVIVKAG